MAASRFHVRHCDLCPSLPEAGAHPLATKIGFTTTATVHFHGPKDRFDSHKVTKSDPKCLKTGLVISDRMCLTPRLATLRIAFVRRFAAN